MHKERPAFGRRLEELVELGAIAFRPEPRSTPSSSGDSRPAGQLGRARTAEKKLSKHLMDRHVSGAAAVTGRPPTPAGRPSTVRNSPPASSSSPSSSTLIRFSASTRSPSSSRRATRRFTIGSGSWKSRSSWVSRLSGSESPRQSLGRRRSMKHSRCVRASRAKTRRGRDSTAAGRQRAGALAGQEIKAMN